MNGGVFHNLSGTSASGDVDGCAEFITSRVRKQTHRGCVFRSGPTQSLIWGPLKAADLRDLSMNTRVAAQIMLDRLRADAAGLRRDFACFSLKRISGALGGAAAHGADMHRQLVYAVRSLGRAFILDERILELEYIDALPVILKHWRNTSTPGAKNRKGKSFSNAKVW